MSNGQGAGIDVGGTVVGIGCGKREVAGACFGEITRGATTVRDDTRH